MTEIQVPHLQVGGTLRITDLYIERSEDASVYELLASGEYCNILTSRQMGKSSLMVRLMTRLVTERDAQTVTIDMAGDLGTSDSADRWYIAFLALVALQLDLECDVEDWWRDCGRGTANARLLQFFREVIGASGERPIYVFVDEVDATLALPYSDDFFTAVRSIYNQRATEPAFRRLTFCLIGVASPSELIKERRTTPYNVGQTVELRDFDPDRDDLGPLYRAMSSDGVDGAELVRAVLVRTGGHPFMTAALCEHARTRGACTAAMVYALIDEVCTANTHRAITSHLHSIDAFLSERLHDADKTLRVYHSILRGRRVPDQTIATHLELRLSGLVKRNADGLLVPRNKLYLQRFGPAWLARTRPMRTQRRLIRATIALGALAVTAIAGAIYLVQNAPPQAEVRDEEFSALGETTDPDQAASKLAAICDRIGLGAVVSDEQLRAAQQHVSRLWQTAADQLEDRAQHARDTQAIDEALIRGAKAGVRRGSLSESTIELYRRYGMRSLVSTLRVHNGNVYAVRWLDGKRVVSVGSDERVRLLDIEKEFDPGLTELVPKLSPALDTCPDGSCVLTAALPAIGYLWDDKLKQRARFPIPRGSEAFVQVWSLAVDPGGPRIRNAPGQIAVADDRGNAWSGSLVMPSTDSNSLEAAFKTRPAFVHVTGTEATGRTYWPVYTARFSTSGKQLVTAALDGIRIIDVGSGAMTKLDLRVAEPHDARLSSDGSRVAIAGRDEAVVYDLGPPVERVYRSGDARTFHTIAFLPDDKQVVIAATTGDDHGLVVIAPLRKDGPPPTSFETSALVRDAEVSSAGSHTRLATAHADGTIRIWQIDPALSDGLDDVVAIWKSWQRRLGLTVDDDDHVVPLYNQRPQLMAPYPRCNGPRRVAPASAARTP